MRVIRVSKILTPSGILEGHFILENRGFIEGILPEGELSWAGLIADEVLEYPPDSVALPGFFDHHAHTFQRGLSLVYPNLSTAGGLDEAAGIIRANLNLPDRPIIFTEYDDSGWEKPPTKAWLDAVAGETPVILRRVCGHKAVANTAACRLLPDPGQADENGILLEEAALHLFNIFRPSPDTTRRAALAGQDECLKLGITGIREIGSARTFQAWQALDLDGLLEIEVEFYFLHGYLPQMAELGLRTGFGGKLRIGGIKVFLDGSIGARTARFKKPYADTGQRGVFTFSEDNLVAVIRKSEEAGLRLLIHAIGDEAIGMALSAYREAAGHGNPLRHTIEHAEAITGDQLKRAADLGLVLSIQPNFLQWQAQGGLYEKALGKRRAKALNPFRDMIDSGATVVFGSDSMPPGPQYGISLAMNHPAPEQSIEAAKAIGLYTKTELAPGQPLLLAITNGIPGTMVYGTFCGFSARLLDQRA
ncbi:MAG: amidohydrolase family protein [Candidatus Hydrothermia bacterium]